MSDRPSRSYLMFRFFCTVFVIVYLISLFWNTLSGGNMFPFNIVIWVSVVLTIWLAFCGWFGVTVGSHVLLKDDPGFQEWKRRGGRPFWDGGLYWPINTSSDVVRGFEEPESPTFVPPESWRYQCPVCGARVEKQIDVCWQCDYGHDNNSTPYHER